jgi:hypothetical protein
MKVRMYGFEIESESAFVPIAKLMTHLVSNTGKPDQSRSIERRIFLDETSNKNYYLGLVVTVKDQKRFCRLENTKGQIKITVENLTGNDKLMEFNFFVINKKNGIGLYQHYHQSCGLNVFGGYLISNHKDLREKFADEEIETKKRTEEELSASRERSIRKKYRGRLRFSQLVRKDSLEIILKECKALKAFEYEISALDVDVRAGIPLSKYVKKLREKLTFSQGWSVPVLASAIAGAVKELSPRNGRVYALNEFDEDVSLRIFDMPDNFGEEDFDDVALKLHNLDLNAFGSHKVANELVYLCQSDDLKHIFEANLK